MMLLGEDRQQASCINGDKGEIAIRSMKPAMVKLEAFIRKKMREEGIPGMTVSVTDRDRILWRRDFGYANLDKKKPVTRNTLFQIGSISKSFVSVALLQLVEEGKVDLNKPAKHYLPWLEIKSKYRPVTLHDLLSHTAGIMIGPELTTEANTDILCLREYEASRPGEMFYYSNVGYKIVGEVLSRLDGKSISTILQERVIRPLGMKSSLAEIINDQRSKSAVGYWPLYDDRPMGKKPEWAPCTWIETENADGAILSTSEDMGAYMRMLLNKGNGPRGRVLSEDGFGLLTSRAIRCDYSYDEEYYGYGLLVAPYRGHTMLSHTGGMLGFISSMHLDLDEGIGAFASTNCRKNVDDVTRMAVELFRRARNGEPLAASQKCALPPQPRLEDYTGIYSDPNHDKLEVRKVRSRLVLKLGKAEVPLSWREGDSFFVDCPSMEKYLLSFGRQNGKVVEAFHGSDWYVNAMYAGKKSFRLHNEWKGLTGHYRSHNPWLTNFRVIDRKGELFLVSPSGHEDPMARLGKNIFRVGPDKRTPEFIRFDAFIDGEAQAAVFSGCMYARCHTP